MKHEAKCQNGFSVDHDEKPTLPQIRQAEITVEVCTNRFKNCDLDCPIRRLTFLKQENQRRV